MPRQKPNQPPRLRSIAGRTLPHDIEAERAVISACFLDPTRIDDCSPLVSSRDFFAAQHAEIWSAVTEIRSENEPVDVVTVSRRLRDRDRLAQVGGPGYLAELVDATPAVANVITHAALVSKLAKRRRMIEALHQAWVEGYEAPEGWESDVARVVSDVAGKAQRSAVLDAWRPLPVELLLSPPAPRRWLLRHPTHDGNDCAPGQGDGLLPLGKAGILSSEGGTGKTIILVQLAISVATGRPWLGHFDVSTEARGGRVLLALAEEDVEEVHRRLYAAADALRLTDDERRRVAELVVVLPLAGRPVAIVGPSPDGTEIIETDELRAMRTMLHRGGDRGYALIVLDPLARWAGADTESDNAAATRFVQAAESLCEVPGRPTVLVAHHSSKTARRTGQADSRGVTAITDGFRWAGTLRNDGGDVRFGQAKSNYSIPMPEELRLVRGRGGVLRVPSAEEQARDAHLDEMRRADKEAEREAKQEAAITNAERRILDALSKAAHPVTSRKAMCELVSGTRGILQAAVTRLITSKRIIKDGESYIVAPDHGSNGAADDRRASSSGPSRSNGADLDQLEEEDAQLHF